MDPCLCESFSTKFICSHFTPIQNIIAKKTIHLLTHPFNILHLHGEKGKVSYLLYRLLNNWENSILYVGFYLFGQLFIKISFYLCFNILFPGRKISIQNVSKGS